MSHIVCSLALACLATGFSHAQTAVIAVSHDDIDGIVVPGETIRITAWHSRSEESILAGLGGDLRASSDLGVAANVASDLRLVVHGSTYPASHGTSSGGSVVGVSYEFVSHPSLVPSVQLPYGNWGGLRAVFFDWTAPAVSSPTTVDFNWVPSTSYPDVYAILPPYGQFIWASLPTTYTGASILVIPAPASVCALLALTLPRRRR